MNTIKLRAGARLLKRRYILKAWVIYTAKLETPLSDIPPGSLALGKHLVQALLSVNALRCL